ncbi:MAG: prolipoprotein diacylglyceryl transferase [Halobacteriovoraceae bacterium]|nr:prolipoprotein diacylglyceryl transferase [Halobacteriovoraceae bacterium]
MQPILLEIFGQPIYSYPLLMGIGWGVGYNLSSLYWEEKGLSQKLLIWFFLLTFVAGWIGAKVFFLIFSAPDKVLYYGKELNFWFGGGFVFYGGFIFALIAAVIFVLKSKSLRLETLALITPGLTLGHAIGRMGCFLAGCCYGDICELPSVLHFLHLERHPVQLYEVLGLMALFFIHRKQIVKGIDLNYVLSTYLLGYGALRFLNEFFRGDAIRGVYFGLSTSQWVSVTLLIPAIFFLLRVKKA